MRTGKPICYTSVDSVLQIAAHEEAFGLERLYDVCRIARRLCDPLQHRPRHRAAVRRLGRARFPAHAAPQGFRHAAAAGQSARQRGGASQRDIVSIGKIGDIFAHRDTGREFKGAGNTAHVDGMLAALAETAEGGLIFANFVDFDTEYGHRRDVAGLCRCLEAFDARLPEIIARAAPGRSRRHHRRSRQRSDLARHRPYARARADPRLRPRRGAGPDRAARRRSPISARRSRGTQARAAAGRHAVDLSSNGSRACSSNS